MKTAHRTGISRNDSTRRVDERGFEVADLLSEVRERRRHALRIARSRRWIDAYGEVRVRVVRADATSETSFDELLWSLSQRGRGHSIVLAHTLGVIVVSSEQRAGSSIEDWIRSLTPPGVRITTIGSAALPPECDDLLRVVEEASTAAEIVDQVGDALTSTRAEDLGGWRLLRAVGGDPALIASASPAADELWRSDAVRRQTVETYLDSGCNVALACRVLHIHRTTLYYRLDGMPEIVREALADGLKRSTLHLSLKLLRLWNASTTAPGADKSGPLAPRAAGAAPVQSLHQTAAPTPLAASRNAENERSVE